MRRRGTKQRGAAMVETGLVLVLFIVALVGIVDFAQFLYLHQTIANRVRTVTRTASVYNLTVAQIQNRICYGSDTVPSPSAVGYMGLKPVNVAAEKLDTSTTERRIVVTVSGLRYKTLSPFLFGAATMLPVRVTSTIETP